MALAAPDYFAGANDPLKGAYSLFTHAGWVRRRCNEILAEATLDVFKVYDLASHCFLFKAEADKWISGVDFTLVREEVVRLTLGGSAGNTSKTAAEINDDYKALYAEAGVFIAWVNTNLPIAGGTVPSPTVTVNKTFPGPDLTVRITKGAGVTTRVQALRDVFL